MTEIEIRRATHDDEEAIEDFLEVTYGTVASHKGDLRSNWQFVANPFILENDNSPTVWIAISSSTVVGQIAVQDGLLHIQGTDVSAGWIVDVMIRSEFRGRGLGHLIHEVVARERSILVTLTMAAATRRMAERANCITLGPVSQLIRPLAISGKTVGRFIRYKVRAKPYLEMLGRVFIASKIAPVITAGMVNIWVKFLRNALVSASEGNPKISEVDYFSDEIDTLWSLVHQSYPAIFHRDKAFLNWRFCDVPNLEYRRFVLRHNDIIKGYLVTRTCLAEELPAGIIVDLFAAPDDHETINSLIGHAIHVLGPTSEYIEAAASTHQYLKAFKHWGFFRAKTMHPTVVCAELEMREKIEESRDSWHFSKADHDWDQIHPV